VNPARGPLRVLLTADTVGGVWTFAVQLCAEFARCGVDVLVAAMGPRARPAQRAQLACFPRVALREADLRLEWMEDPWDDLNAASDWLLRLEAEYAPDVVHLNGYAHAALAWHAPVMVTAHSCVRSWWRAVRGGPAPAEWDAYTRMVARGLQAARLVVAPSKAMLRSLLDHYGPLGEARVIPNGTAPDYFRPGVKEPFILGVGRFWDEAKNLGTLASAGAGLGWPLRLVGDSEAGEAERWPGVELLGRQEADEVAALLSRAAIFAHPARYEPFGLAPLEAGLAGCALVLGDLPSLREIWGEDAWFVGPDDGAGLRAALTTLIACPALRQTLARRARERALLFTAARMARAYLEAYAGLTETVDPASPISIPA
jgi:glycogen synthase